jgi:hypothetical protein
MDELSPCIDIVFKTKESSHSVNQHPMEGRDSTKTLKFLVLVLNKLQHLLFYAEKEEPTLLLLQTFREELLQVDSR